MSTKGTARVIGCAILAAGWMSGAHAFEGGVSPYPAGATGTNIGGLPPITGLFALEQFNYNFSNGLYDNNGNKLPIPFQSSVISETTRLLAAYPFHFLGASVYSQFVIPVVSLHTEVFGQKNTQNGLSNLMVTPVMLQWLPSNTLQFVGGIDVSFLTGSYSPTKPSVAVGYTSVQPVFAIRYNVPNGIDVALSNRLMFNQKNGETNYQSGSAYVGEFAAGWNFGKWKIGVVGAYLNQFTDDKQNGVTVVGNRARTLGLGPSIVYDGGAYNINVNYQQGLYAANTTKSNNVWLNIAVPLWASFGMKH